MNPMHCHQQRATEDASPALENCHECPRGGGNTSLHLACDEDRVEEARWLVTQGARTYTGDEEKTPLQVAKGGLG